MTSTEDILDAEIVEDVTEGQSNEQSQGQQAGSGRRSPGEAVRAAAAARYERARQTVTDPGARAAFGQARRESTSLVVDGIRGRRLRRREAETLAEYRERGNPDAPVREDLRSHYERAVDRQAKAAERAGADPVAEYTRIGAWVVAAAGEFACVADVLGTAPPGPLAAFGALTGLGNLVIGPVLWRKLKREGQVYRDKQAAWSLGAAPGEADAASDDQVSVDYLTTVLADAGVLRAGESVSLAEPVFFDEYGWIARIVLPGTQSAGAVLKAHERITSALGANLKKQQVSVTAETPRVLSLRVYRQLPFTGDPVPHPLVGTGREHSVIRDGLPIGPDINGTQVRVNPAQDLHGLLVAASNMGKSVHVRNLVVTVAHSSDAEIGGVFDGKASGDYDPVRAGVGWYLDTMESGPDWWEQLAEALEGEVAEASQRQQRIRRGQQLGLRFVVLDEFQVGFGYPKDRTKGSPAARVLQACEELSRLGRSAGLRLILASQSYDGNVLPSGILNNFLWRLVGYISSETMDPKDTVGKEGLGMGLVPDEVFTKAQKGAVIALSSSLDDGYALCRGWFQDPQELAADVDATAPVRSDAGSDIGAGDASTEESGQPGGISVPELLAALQDYADKLAASGDDRDEVPSSELHDECAPAGMSLTKFGRELARMGIAKIGGAQPRRALSDIRRAVLRVRNGGPVAVAEDDAG